MKFFTNEQVTQILCSVVPTATDQVGLDKAIDMAVKEIISADIKILHYINSYQQKSPSGLADSSQSQIDTSQQDLQLKTESNRTFFDVDQYLNQRAYLEAKLRAQPEQAQ